MMKRIGKTAALVLALIIGINVQAQQFEQALNTMANKYQPEKIFIHYDKEYYVAGETIWFKAYLFSDGKPSSLSNNLYLQITNSKGHLVANKKFPVLGAVAKGSITIQDSLPQGNYYIRAATPYMLNYDESFVYKKNLFVFRPGAAKEKSQPQTMSLQFFPESGQLVDGILTVVGFKATDQWGTPMEVNGIIRSDDGTTIASFKSYHDGIGKVPFKPQAGKKYIAEVETDAGKRTFNLPEVSTSGINLKVQDEKGGKKFQLSRSEKNKAELETVHIIAQINNHLVYENEINFEDYPSIIGHLLTDSLPSGILHFTVFNKAGLPLAERICFVDNHEYASGASLTAVKTNTERRAENNLELTFSDLIQTSCSVSVTDMSGASFNDHESIWSRLLLTSDLKGYVFNPSWYFSAQSDSTKQGLDNLMLTHGWSRFNWTKILASEFPVTTRYMDEAMLVLSGKVLDEKTKQPVSGGKLNVFLEAEDSTSLNLEMPVDNAGNYSIDSLLFGGKADFFYAYTDAKGKPKPVTLVADESLSTKAASSLPVPMPDPLVVRDVPATGQEISTRFNYVKTQFNDSKELENVTVQAKSNMKPSDIVNEKYTSGVFRGPGKVTLDNINEPATDKSMNAVDYIKNRIQQLEIQNNVFVNRKNVSLMTGKKWLVDIFIDERPANMLQLRLLRTSDIALVKFFEAGFVGAGSAAPGGAVSVYTKEQNAPENKPDKLNSVSYQGYAISKQFYNPDYSNKDIKQPSTDNRTTLYWNPDVYADLETKSVKLNFFNNDFSKKFKVVVEGFDASGKLVHIEKLIGN